ncbi:G-type lectin S-receptor-like serine/threonine-protein kinase [Citrus sinensis]|uniref:G-type lectin S-receptor-like serine/threonine-protein kinase n=2 Tax=Citrus sinensis TaxID=2711 RepID=A0ACB8N4Q5_CITSI|nr:G-type lectin S-receptor-like serine/threonine-protein kinase [Citrus sinensis]
MVGRRERFQRRIISRWSDNHLPSAIFIIYAILSCFSLPHCSARDNITSSSLLSNGQTLVSAGERFELGFFSPADSSEAEGIPRYVGIWYYKSNPRIFVWVANRENPLVNKSGVLAILEDGNLKLLDESGTPYWYTDVESSSSPHTVAKLMDSGNFVLQDDQVRKNLWESFKYPTDTFLAGMYMGENLSLTSWAGHDDPKPGNFTFKMDQGENQYQITKPLIRHWRSAESKDVFSSNEIIPYQILNLLSNFSHSVKPTGKNAVHPNLIVPSIDYSRTRLIMNYTGEIQYWTEDKVKGWSLIWREPRDNCSVFHYCGNFGICNSNHKRKCQCLQGFVPSSPERWSSEDFLGGCIRKTALCGGKDMFLKRQITKVGETDSCLPVASEAECSKKCRGFCPCTAYSYKESKRRDEAGTCCIWIEELKDLREDFSNGGHELYIRVAATDLESAENKTEGGSTQQVEAFNGRKKHQWTLIFGMTIASGIILSCIIIYFYTRRKRINSQGRSINRPNMAAPFYESARHVKDMVVDSDQFKEEEKQGIDLPFIDFESILAATDNFSEANKLGKGGFGPVYKAKFPGGQQIAVKRLSSASGQGLEEFKNEVVLIARLQHRNLVRLLGYCIEGHEKILLYEYMLNKSLDFFIFGANVKAFVREMKTFSDPTLSALLHWEMRFNIIIGIARGLLYLHQDSRLRIIHRDLKTSNILLDQEMNPKISDFGLARIFKGKQTEGTTNRVVGTYGYMSPEYALDGFFSVKSDVFSFGVVVLEIISGKRNTGFYNSEQALSLLGYAWKLWQEGKALDMMDQKLHASSKPNEILKCINVGLLCVQEDPNDRPTMSDVVIMLGSEAMNLATPRRPAFVIRRGSSSSASSSNKPESNNELTNTLECR